MLQFGCGVIARDTSQGALLPQVPEYLLTKLRLAERGRRKVAHRTEDCGNVATSRPVKVSTAQRRHSVHVKQAGVAQQPVGLCEQPVGRTQPRGQPVPGALDDPATVALLAMRRGLVQASGQQLDIEAASRQESHSRGIAVCELPPMSTATKGRNVSQTRSAACHPVVRRGDRTTVCGSAGSPCASEKMKLIWKDVSVAIYSPAGWRDCCCRSAG